MIHTSHPVTVATALLDAIGRRDVDSLLPLLHDHAELVSCGPEGEQTLYRGCDGARRLVEDFWRDWSELRLQVSDAQNGGDDVLVLGRLWARGQGRIADSPRAWVVRVAGGKVERALAFRSRDEARAYLDR